MYIFWIGLLVFCAVLVLWGISVVSSYLHLHASTPNKTLAATSRVASVVSLVQEKLALALLPRMLDLYRSISVYFLAEEDRVVSHDISVPLEVRAVLGVVLVLALGPNLVLWAIQQVLNLDHNPGTKNCWTAISPAIRLVRLPCKCEVTLRLAVQHAEGEVGISSAKWYA